MTQICFYHGAADRIQAAADWLALAWAERRTVRVYAPDPKTADRIDRQLWIQPATGFVPHCAADSPQANETALLIDRHCPPPRPGEWLLNLSDEIPAGFEAYEGLVEVVSLDEAVTVPARQRFRHYRDQGCPMLNQDVAQGFGFDGR